jgi:hypothetical protein
LVNYAEKESYYLKISQAVKRIFKNSGTSIFNIIPVPVPAGNGNGKSREKNVPAGH